MADPSKDFRYKIGEVEVEGYQITESSRYQDKLWPDWLNSKDFMTVDGAPWITLQGKELRIPPLAWIVRDASGNRSIVEALDFENYVKVVPNVPPSVQLAAVPDLPVEGPVIHSVHDDELLLDVKVAFELLQLSQYDEALKVLRVALSSRAQWCNCSPGQCEKLDPWSCRDKSPLVKKPRKPRKKKPGKKT